MENRMQITDDGTMDTVITDTQTGNEYRYNYDPMNLFCEEHGDDCETVQAQLEQDYVTFVQQCINDAAELADTRENCCD